MADYKELIRKAIEALPENNGAARRAVYEKARAALVGQLRGLNPPLAARDITQHRLQLEDCIRQVEQEASEQVIAGLKQNEEFAQSFQPALPPPRQPAPRQNANGRAQPAASPRQAASREPAQRLAPASPARTNATAPARPLAAAPRQASAAPAPAPARANGARAGGPAIASRAAPAQPAPAALPPVRATTPAGRTPRSGPLPRSLRSESERERERERVPDTIEEIIAAAEEDLDPIDFEDEIIDDLPEDEPEAPAIEEPEAPMFRLEERRGRRPAQGTQAPVEQPRLEPPPRQEPRQLPAIVARAEAAKAGRSGPRPANGERGPRVNGDAEPPRRANGVTPDRRGPQPATARAKDSEPIRLPRPTPPAPALSSEREVELEDEAPEADAQVAIERAIATLEREARNDGESPADTDEFEAPPPPTNNRRRNGLDTAAPPRSAPQAALDSGFARAPVETERGGGSAVTIFLLVFLILLVGAGGGGYWAWREGFIDFDAMFGKSPAATEQGSVTPDQTAPTASSDNSDAAPTNTEQAPSTTAQSDQPLTTAPDASAPTATPTPAPAAAAPATTPVPAAAPPAPTPSAEPSAQTGGAPKSEDRLTQSDSAAPAAPTPAPAAGAATATSQSLLLEASQDGTTGAVPFSGTVDWSKGTDEMGQPTLVGKASIPARNLGVSVLIRKNNDPALPASHLMEINFTVNASFAGGAIASLPGVLLKNEELVQGTPLVGASARVVGNSFLFALSSSATDEATNQDLLTSRKWMDLAIVYATGKKAIITLEKDDKAEQLFTDVFAAWGKAAPAAAAPKG